MTRIAWFPILVIAVALLSPAAGWMPAAVGQELEAEDFAKARKELREAYQNARTADEKRAILDKFRELELREARAATNNGGSNAGGETRPSGTGGNAGPNAGRRLFIGTILNIGTLLADAGRLSPEVADRLIDYATADGVDPWVRDRLRELRDAIGKGKNSRLDEIVDQPGTGGDPGTEPDPTPEDVVPILIHPKDGSVFLVGQEVEAQVDPEDATVDASGKAKVIPERTIRFTGVGEATLHARSGSNRSEPSKVTVAGLEVLEVTVLETLEITDAKPPHFKKGEDKPRIEPAAIFQNKPLVMKVRLQATEPLSQGARVTVFGVAKDAEVKAEVDVPAGNGVAEAEFRTEKEFTSKVQVHALEFKWYVEVDGKRVEAGAATPLRVYTTHKAPVKNVSGRGGAINTKLHYELACSWANGASQNVGSGADSIGWNCDNRMRHHVHPDDYKQGKEPFVDAYKPGSGKPTNYDDLPSSWSVRSSGERGVSSLYYPPLEPKKDYEKYDHYQNNFGWWVLDNPTHTGGRCNQQAALVADVLGTLGIEAGVHYLERRGVGKKTGRPVRQYFYAAGGSGPWNFHGLCKATMADGSEWLYDGSFSSPPNRKNGQREWAESEGGPFIQKFGPWYYDDWSGGQVPANDVPDQSGWIGIGGRAQ